jgi:membrane protease YdiL (CAAX protease family)
MTAAAYHGETVAPSMRTSHTSIVGPPASRGADERGEPRLQRPKLLVVVSYGAMTVVALVIGFARGAPNLLVCAPSMRWDDRWTAHATSAAVGLLLGAAIVVLTRWLVRTREWATALHEDLRPVARALGVDAVPLVAIASAVGEESLFRGALVPAIGVVASSVVFGAMHQLRGRSRIAWWIFATLVGLAFATLFRLTGSLVGPLLAHALVNGINLRFLMTHDPTKTPSLGGLLGPRA